MDSIQNSLFEAMKIFTESYASNSSTTIECKIIEIVDAAIGSYKVSYRGNTFLVYTNNQSVYYSVDEIVYVLIPENDYSKKKMILGSVNNVSGYIAEAADSLYLPITNNLITLTNNEFKLSSYIEDSIVVQDEHSIGTIIKKYLEEDNKTIFKLSCSIKTDLVSDQQMQGNYGISFGIPAIDTATNAAVTRYFTLDVGNIIGSPYILKTWTPQSIYFSLEDKYTYNENGTIEIKLFTYNFPLQDGGKASIKDVNIKDISLVLVDEVQSSNNSGYVINLQASDGLYFLTRDTQESKTISASLYVNGKSTSLTNANIYWFEEDASIKKDSAQYSTYGGTGWKCLNEKINVTQNADGTETYSFDTSSATLDIKSFYPITQKRIKCTIIYNAQVITSTIVLKSLYGKNSISLKSSAANNTYLKDIGKVELTVIYAEDGVTNKEENKNLIKYSWLRYNKLGELIENDNIEIKSYNVIIDGAYHTTVTFPVNEIVDFNTISCTAFNGVGDKRTTLGTSTIVVSVANNLSYYISIDNGSVIYKYDTDGDSPMIEAFDGPPESKVNEIKPLQFHIYKSDGVELSESEYGYCKYSWYVPKNSLIKINSNIVSRESTEYYIIEGYGNDTSLFYTIADRYNNQLADNTIILEVTLSGITIKQASTLNFIKEGNNGTNGTKYSALIVAGSADGFSCGVKDSNGLEQRWTAAYDKQNQKWYFADPAQGYKLVDWNNKHPFYLRVYKNNEILSNSAYTVSWSMFDYLNTKPVFAIDTTYSNNLVCHLTTKNEAYKTGTNILKAAITIKDNDTNTIVYSYYPLQVVEFNTVVNNMIAPVICGGCNVITYDSNGLNPNWNAATFYSSIDSCTLNWSVNEDIDSSTGNKIGHLSIKDAVNENVTVIPDDKYRNAQSNNYIALSTNMDAAIKNKLLSAISNAQALIGNYNNQSTQNTIDLNGLQSFADTYNGINFKDTLAGLKNFLNLKSAMVSNLISLQKTIVDIDDFKARYSSIIWNTANGVVIANVRAIIPSMIEAIYNLKSDFADLTSLENYDIVDLSKDEYDNLVSSIGKVAVSEYQNLYDAYKRSRLEYNGNYIAIKKLNSELSQYNNLYNALISMTNILINSGMSTQYAELGKEIQTLIIDGFHNASYLQHQNLLKELEYTALLGTWKSNDEQKLELWNYVIDGINTNNQKAADQITYLNKCIDTYNSYLITFSQGSIYIRRPILLELNRYSLSNLNAWDGNKLELNDNGNYIIASQVGAGKKNSDNTFTGLVMGIQSATGKSYVSSSDEKVGLFGFYHGEQSLFFNANDGSAIFGKTGSGTIEILPGQNKSLIKGSGMTIDLAKPSIVYDNGNFSVDENGILVTKNAILTGTIYATQGTIGGFNINTTDLSSANKDIKISSTEGINIGKGNFKVGLDGKAELTEATLYGSNTNTKLTIGDKFKLMSSEKYYAEIGNQYLTLHYDGDTKIAKLYSCPDIDTYNKGPGLYLKNTEDDVGHLVLNNGFKMTNSLELRNFSGVWKSLTCGFIESVGENGYVTVINNGTVRCQKIEANESDIPYATTASYLGSISASNIRLSSGAYYFLTGTSVAVTLTGTDSAGKAISVSGTISLPATTNPHQYYTN